MRVASPIPISSVGPEMSRWIPRFEKSLDHAWKAILDPEPEPGDCQHVVRSSDTAHNAFPTEVDLLDKTFEIELRSEACEREESGSSNAHGYGMSNWLVGSISTIPKSTIVKYRCLIVWSLLAQGIAATMATSGSVSTTLPRPGVTTQPPTSHTPSRRNALIDTIIFGSGFIVCLGLVVGARYWRGSWGMPAPAMGASGIAFLLWKNDGNISAEVTWITFAVWATATLVNVWTAKFRLPVKRFTSYIIFSSILTGALIYTFAAALQERIINAIPSCTAFSFYTGEVALRKRGVRLNTRDEDSVKNGTHGDEDDVC